ncbi:MAG: DUF4062 domain-containing protein [Candidatus Sumerlaeaceae bacterium]|nr:DUF4062 domain-containing protein [Candidatus Sumerlaeaceae bacterium]
MPAVRTSSSLMARIPANTLTFSIENPARPPAHFQEMSNRPHVFVSSTFYDLKQVRKDLSEFLMGELGYEALLFENPEFPIDPGKTTIQNCTDIASEDADILILIVGLKYGSLDPKTKLSVTRLEFEAARARGVPVYIYVDQQLHTMLPVWKQNPSLKLDGIVDNSQVFEFVAEVADKHKLWITPFSSAQDLIGAIRAQFAYRMKQGLKALRAYDCGRLPDYLSDLRGRSLQLVLEKPRGWEYSLAAQVLTDEIAGARGLRYEYDSGISVGAAVVVPDSECLGFVNGHINGLSIIGNNIGQLINVYLAEAVGALGEPGDAEKIVFWGRSMGAVYRDAIKWALQVRRISTTGPFSSAVPMVEGFSIQVIEVIESFAKQITKVSSDASTAFELGRVPEPAHIEFVLDSISYEPFLDHVKDIARNLENPG